MAITSIAGHFCRKEFGALSPLPVVDMIDEVGRAVTARGLRRIGILGTRTVMESRFYGGVTTATVLLPVGCVYRKLDSAISVVKPVEDWS